MNSILRKITKWPLFLLGYAILVSIAYFPVEAKWQKGWICVVALLAGALIFALLVHLVARRDVEKSISTLAIAKGKRLDQRMNGLAFPYAVVNGDGKILWGNRAFKALTRIAFPESNDEIDYITVLFPQIKLEQQDPEGDYLALGSHTYRAYIQALGGEAGEVTMLFTDETEHLDTLTKLRDERNVCGLAYIDNYEDLLGSTEREEQGMLGALIEQHIRKYFRSYGTLVTKMERDRYFLSVDAKGLRALEEDRFSLLEDVKTIRLSNTMPVSLSLTFGADGSDYENNLELARSAMETALGRGGDQAIVKTPEKVDFFGGKVQGEATQTQVKARVKAQALRDLMESKDQVFIMGHAMGDNDSFGACIAIYRAACSVEKKAYIVFNSVSSSVRPLWERFQQSADYPNDMFLSSEEAIAYFHPDALVVVVDTNTASRTDCPELLVNPDNIVVFDHHRAAADTIKARLYYVEPYSSSACEMTAEVLQYFSSDLKPRPLEAEAIYSGILVDTHAFTDRTGARTFEAAAYLKRSGADLVKIKKLLREDWEDYRVKADSIRSAQIVDGRYAFAVCNAEGSASPSIVGSQVADELLKINTVQASFVFTPIGDTVFVSARSIDELNVQRVMEQLGGGGHINSAGMQFAGISIEEAMQKVKDVLDAMTKESVIG